MLDKKSVAVRVLLRGLQSWGQSVDERIKAWQDAYDFMELSVKLFSVKLSVGVEDGRKIFVFDGTDAKQAKKFMEEVQAKFPLGSFEEEEVMIAECLEKYKKS